MWQSKYCRSALSRHMNRFVACKREKSPNFKCCYVLSPASNHTVTHPLPHLWDRGENQKGKDRKFMGWDTDSLIGKAKATCTNRANQGIQSLVASYVSSLEKLLGLGQEAKEHCPSCTQMLRRVYFMSYIQTHHPMILVWSPSTAQKIKFYPVGLGLKPLTYQNIFQIIFKFG